jgi:hypothetical protein
VMQRTDVRQVVRSAGKSPRRWHVSANRPRRGAGRRLGPVTAGAPAEFHERVTVIDRDPAAASGEYRRGGPQGRHAHNLLPGAGAARPLSVSPRRAV